MERQEYPGLHKHRGEHFQLTDRTLEFLRDYECGKVDLAAKSLEFLAHWLKHHILETGKEYGPFLNARGIF
jgi:hemerythrin